MNKTAREDEDPALGRLLPTPAPCEGVEESFGAPGIWLPFRVAEWERPGTLRLHFYSSLSLGLTQETQDHASDMQLLQHGCLQICSSYGFCLCGESICI